MSQEAETRKLLDFYDLTWNETCLKFHRTKRTVGTASNLQVRRPLYGDAVDSWKQYQKFLQPLLEKLKRT